MKGLSNLRHPFMNSWIQENSLVVSDTSTEFGSIVGVSTEKFYETRFLFGESEESDSEQIKRLNSLFGLSLSDDILKVKSVGAFKKTLSEISQEVRTAQEISSDSHLHILGITLPKRNGLYVEFRGTQGGMLIDNYCGIPISEEFSYIKAFTQQVSYLRKILKKT